MVGDTEYWLHLSLRWFTATAPCPTAVKALRARHRMLGLFQLSIKVGRRVRKCVCVRCCVGRKGVG